jgi:hypothetical protein
VFEVLLYKLYFSLPCATKVSILSLTGFLAINEIYLYIPDSSVRLVTGLQADDRGFVLDYREEYIYIWEISRQTLWPTQRSICVDTYLHSPIRKDGAVLNSVEGLLYRNINDSSWNSVLISFLFLSSLQLSHLLGTSNINLDELRKIASSSRRYDWEIDKESGSKLFNAIITFSVRVQLCYNFVCVWLSRLLFNGIVSMLL